MRYKKILVTGGAGFVGSTLCMHLKKVYPRIEIVAFDNLMRRGSELNLARFQKQGISFVHGDVRNKEDLLSLTPDLIIECSAEPSVMAGVGSSPEYLLNTNLIGAINCFELARIKKADIIFLSTSRVYPVAPLNALHYREEKTRFTLTDTQKIAGASKKGIAENFPLTGIRSLYGATKLSAELLLQEYVENYQISGVINRFGLISGPWQMGKIDQGIIAYWMAHHIFQKPLFYIGFGGTGKQVRDVIHVDDVFDIIHVQMQDLSSYGGQIYNIGGGVKQSVSLLELTKLCETITGKTVEIGKQAQTRPGDIKSYVTDATRIQHMTKWKPKRSVEKTLGDIYEWIESNKQHLAHILI